MGRAGLLALAAASAVYAAGEHPNLRVPVPQLRRQVPDWWRTYDGPMLTAGLYGAGLGVGFLTYLSHGTLVIVSAAAMASGNPAMGALLLAPFGMARGLSAFAGGTVAEPDDGPDLVDRLAARPETQRRLANGLGWGDRGSCRDRRQPRRGRLGGPRERDPRDRVRVGGVDEGRGWRRWSSALSAQALGSRARGVASWAVPTAEGAVAVLAISGLRMAAAGLALALLVAFTAHVVRLSVRTGERGLACGCFGGRDVIDVRTALTRNLALAATAVVSVLGAPSRATVRLAIPTELSSCPRWSRSSRLRSPLSSRGAPPVG